MIGIVATLSLLTKASTDSTVSLVAARLKLDQSDTDRVKKLSKEFLSSLLHNYSPGFEVVP